MTTLSADGAQVSEPTTHGRYQSVDQEPLLSDDYVSEQQLDDLRALDGVNESDLQSMQDESPSDDLTKIDGVGPALQERLYSFGFKRFADIAALDNVGVQKLTIQLELDDEVEKQDWRGQAQILTQEKS